ncbi:MAG: hypothetical protein IIW39_03195 [Clostridia bacterium]|nr:hypothetical protein [Clostridia bacterium]
MKKLFVLALALVLCASFSLVALAGEYTILENGNAQYDTAVGYVFDIRAVNDKITGEDAVIMTSNEFTNRIGSWSIWVIAEEIDDSGVYQAIRNSEAAQGTPPEIVLDANQILIAVHSSTSNPEEAAKENWHNWEDKVAFMAVVSGDCFVFDGIDLDNATCTNGKMLCVSYDDVIGGNIKWPDGTETSTPDVSEPVESEAESTPAESTPVENESEDASAETESKTEEPDESKTDIIEDSEIVSSEIEIDGEGGLDTWVWVVIVVAGIAVVAIVITLIFKKK